jgi:hypothetical protein
MDNIDASGTAGSTCAPRQHPEGVPPTDGHGNEKTRPMGRVFDVERMTRFELATLTLAR